MTVNRHAVNTPPIVVDARGRPGMADGTLTAGKFKTVTADADERRAMLLDDAARSAPFPGHDPS